MQKINQIKAQLADEIETLYMKDDENFFTKHLACLQKIFKNAKESALEDVMNDIFQEDINNIEDLTITSSNIAVILETKYKLVNIGSFLAPIWKFLFPFVLSFGAILLTVNSIRDLNVKRLFGINWPTFIIIVISLIGIAVLASQFITKTRHKRMFAVYIKERLDFIILKEK